MSGEHAELAPSSAHRWLQCPGSRALEAAFPETEDSEKAKEGTAAHWAVSMTLLGRAIRAGETAPNGVSVTDEMMEGVDVFLSALPPDSHLRTRGIEDRVDCSRIHSECWGTPDFWVYDASSRTVSIYDYKFGHRHVEAFENWQLIAYAAGVLDRIGVDGWDEQSTTVELVVVQPRDFHRDGPTRTWSMLAAHLRGYFIRLGNAAYEAMGEKAKLAPSPDACRDCKARHACVALQTEAAGAADTIYGHVAARVAPLPVLSRQLTELRKIVALAEAYSSGIEEEIIAAIRRGERAPGWGLQSSHGRKRWARPVEEVIAMGEMMGIPVSKPGAMTPTQAIKAGLAEEIVNAYSETPSGALKLVQMDGTAERIAFSDETKASVYRLPLFTNKQE